MTLTDFLLARIAEDEADVNATRTSSLHVSGEVAAEDALERLASPDRLARECEAKRRIVELHYVGDPDEWSPDQWACRLCQWDEDCDSPKHEHQHGAGQFPCDTLRALALPYVDHPDYRDEWRP